MDPVSHAAFGRSLIGALTAPARPDRRLRGCVPAAVLGSLSPDLDAVVMPFGWDRYLRVHEIGTHTIAGTLACAIATAAVVYAFNRSSRYSWLVAAAWIGAASHVLLDLLSSARLRPAWPLADTVVSLPVFAMADPWVFVLCVAAAVGFIVGQRPRWRHAGAGALVALLLFVLAKAVLGVVSVSNYQRERDRAGDVVTARVIEAEWASLHTWHVLDRTARQLRFWSVGAGSARQVFSWPVEAESSVVAGSRSLSTVRNFLRAHELGFAVVLPGHEGRTLVLWSDIRFCRDATAPGARMPEPIVQAAGGNTRLACALWFGGELDADGRPRLEIVKVGGLTQTRVPDR